MPNLDGTGPMGQGSQTGKKTGNCGNQNTTDGENQSVARRFMRWCCGRGNGQGNGQGNGMGRSKRGGRSMRGRNNS